MGAAYQMVPAGAGMKLSINLPSISLIFLPAERKAGICLSAFAAPALQPTSIAPDSPRFNTYSRLMFLQLFRHRHCVAMSPSSTWHSSVLIHRQASHSMLQRQNIYTLAAKENMVIYFSHFSVAYCKYEENYNGLR